MTRPRWVDSVTRKAALRHCPACKAQILIGISDGGYNARVDPTPVTRTAELVLFLAGRPCYAVYDGQLTYRDRWRLRRPASPVFAEHRCGDPIPADGHAPSLPVSGRFVPDYTAEPPF